MEDVGLMSLFVCWDCHHKGPQTRGLTCRNVLSPSSGGQKSQIKVLEG